jgi:very-short-patch-repair endonuclease
MLSQSHPLLQWSPLILLVLAAVVFALKLALARMGGARFKLKSPLLSRPEQELYLKLADALPEHIILAQVAFSQLIRVEGGTDRENFSKRLTARQKVADFVVCDHQFQVIAVVECDDKSHDGEKDRKRDEIVKEAGAPTIRWKATKLPGREEIRAAVLAGSRQPA